MDLSRELPVDKFNPRNRNHPIFKQQRRGCLFTVLTSWQDRTGAPRRQLTDVLWSVKLLGIAQSMGLQHDSPQEDMTQLRIMLYVNKTSSKRELEQMILIYL